MRALLYSPKDLVAGLIAFAAVSAIISNAIFMQAGRHPSPMFGSTVVMPLSSQPVVNPLPRPRPLDAATRPPTLDSSLFESKPAETNRASSRRPPKAAIAPAKTVAAAPVRDPVGDLINSANRGGWRRYRAAQPRSEFELRAQDAGDGASCRIVW